MNHFKTDSYLIPVKVIKVTFLLILPLMHFFASAGSAQSAPAADLKYNRFKTVAVNQKVFGGSFGLPFRNALDVDQRVFDGGSPSFSVTGQTQGTPALLWKDTYNSENNFHENAAMIARDAGGNIYYGGTLRAETNSRRDIVVVKTDASGVRQWARRFDSGINELDQLTDISVDSQGNVYLAGSSYRGLDLDFDYVLLKYNPQGELVWTRYYNGGQSSPDIVNSMKIDGANNIYVTGRSFGAERSFGYTTLKYDSNGTLLWRARFNGGIADDAMEVEVDPAGNVYVTGTSSIDRGGATSNVVTIKYNAGGQEVWRNRFDTQTSFGQERAEELEVDCQGNVYVAGNVNDQSGHEENLVLKINGAGATQWTKRWSVSNYAANEIVSAFKADCSGNVVVTGITNINNEINNNDAYTLKLNPANGQTVWQQVYDEQSPGDYQGDNKLMLDAAGNIYVGTTSRISSNYNLVIHKYSPGGQIMWKYVYDNPNNDYDGFIDWRVDRSAPTMLADARGDIYFAGESVIAGEGYDLVAGKIAAARFVRALFDFDGDGKTDIGIFRPSTGAWWITGSLSGRTFAAQFGSATDKLTPGDFTGDGKADIAFFRPSEGFWYVLRSEDFSFFGFPFGSSGDIPVPADYDGDGKTDAAVYRPSNNGWYIQKSSGGIDSITFGINGDIPVTADYDGDGKADIAINRINNGTREWWIRRSGDGRVVAATFGETADKAVQSDYTGDGKADIAFFRPSNGFWYVLRSENGSLYGFPFGSSDDIPVPGDYDGDAKTDAAVFRASENNWYVQRSEQGLMISQFGSAGDKPLENVFIP